LTRPSGGGRAAGGFRGTPSPGPPPPANCPRHRAQKKLSKRPFLGRKNPPFFCPPPPGPPPGGSPFRQTPSVPQLTLFLTPLNNFFFPPPGGGAGGGAPEAARLFPPVGEKKKPKLPSFLAKKKPASCGWRQSSTIFFKGELLKLPIVFFRPPPGFIPP